MCERAGVRVCACACANVLVCYCACVCARACCMSDHVLASGQRTSVTMLQIKALFATAAVKPYLALINFQAGTSRFPGGRNRQIAMRFPCEVLPRGIYSGKNRS